MSRSKGTGTRGQGIAGGGLVARLKEWAKIGSSSTPRTKRDGKSTYIKPGSQNPRKGGPGK